MACVQRREPCDSGGWRSKVQSEQIFPHEQFAGFLLPFHRRLEGKSTNWIQNQILNSRIIQSFSGSHVNDGSLSELYDLRGKDFFNFVTF